MNHTNLSKNRQKMSSLQNKSEYNNYNPPVYNIFYKNLQMHWNKIVSSETWHRLYKNSIVIVNLREDCLIRASIGDIYTVGL